MSEKKYEITKKYKSYLMAIGWLGLSTFTATYLENQYPISEQMHQILLLAFGTFHVVGRLADFISTDLFSRKAEKIEKQHNITVPIGETNSLYPTRAKIGDFIKPDVVAIELSQAIPIAIFPPIALVNIFQSIITARKNIKFFKSLKEASGEIPITPYYKKQNNRKKY